MSLDLISSLDTRFFAEEINSHEITFDLESSLGPDDDLLSLNHLTGDPMIPFHQHEMELMDTGMSSDSDTSGSNMGFVDFDLHGSFDANEFVKFNPSDFPNLHVGINDDIKLEPISPLAQSPQPLSPLGSTFSRMSETRILDTPPISPPTPSLPISGAEIIKVITLDSSGNIQLPNGTKLLVSSNNGVLNPMIPRGSNIQPKPPTSVIKVLPSTASVSSKPSQGQPLVLTPSEYATLTQQGLTKPVEMNTVKSVRPSQPTVPKPITNMASAVNSPSIGHEPSDAKAFKRQQRMIKNRESACLSRKKKKEYVSSLEATISDLNKENQKLKQQNAILQDRVAALEKERSSFTFSASTKKTTALFAVLLVVSFNVAALGNMFLTNQHGGSIIRSSLKESAAVPHRVGGRSLLWETEGDETPIYDSGNTSSQMCPMQINRTESSRIDSELRGWFHAPTQPKIRPPPIASAPVVPQIQPSPSKHELAKVETRPTIVSSTAYRKYLLTPQAARRSNPQYIANNEIQVFESLPDRYLFAAFFEAIQRKDDTFYVVSFSGDHLLLPATEHNNTVRPRMSLLLPAMPMNETMQAPPRHVSMMQIDCEVTNTRLLHVSEDSIPPYYDGNRTADRKAEAGKRAWRKPKKNQRKVDNFEAIYAQDSR